MLRGTSCPGLTPEAIELNGVPPPPPGACTCPGVHRGPVSAPQAGGGGSSALRPCSGLDQMPQGHGMSTSTSAVG